MKSKKMLGLSTIVIASVLFMSSASACPVSNFLNKLFGLKGPTTTVQTPVKG